ncbi:solute carrier family 35 member G1-like [Limulus polyphemus]|uniref:Solute carrier family 35 member G1-like n=1 Tax=Limulus polyphemus TaxID=6850 RepID=A0ABM1C5U3_LIMPO|nr:solute carrier family 35 member G1-like [Limulus polyphemus]
MNMTVFRFFKRPATHAAARVKATAPSESSPLLATTRKRSRWQLFLQLPGLGILCGLSSGIFFATGSLVVALLPGMNSMELLVFRSLLQMAVYSCVIIYARQSLLGVPGERRFLLFRAITGVISVNLIYYSFRLIPLADASTISFSAPVFVSIFACVLLKEPCGVFDLGTVITTMAGVVLIAKPSFLFGGDTGDFSSKDQIMGSIMAFCGCLSVSLSYISMRKLQKTHYSVIIMSFSLLAIFVNSIILTIVNGWSFPACGRDGWLLLLLGFTGIIGQFFVTASLKLEDAGPASIARAIDVVMAFIYQVAFLEESIEWTSILGAVLVCSCVVLTGWRKWKRR